MFDSLFLYAAVIGGCVLAFQLAMMLLGFGDDGGDLAGGDGFDVGGADGADFSGGMDGDLGGDLADADAAHHQTTWSEAADADLGHHSSPWFYEMLSIRTLSAAITFFGLTGKTTLAYGMNPTQALVCAGAAGIAAMYIVFWLFKQVYKLETSGNENIRNAVGKTARVYIPIPAESQGAGKVHFKMQQRLVEYQAVTQDQEKLATGDNVVVVGVVNSDTLEVAKA